MNKVLGFLMGAAPLRVIGKGSNAIRAPIS